MYAPGIDSAATRLHNSNRLLGYRPRSLTTPGELASRYTAILSRWLAQGGTMDVYLVVVFAAQTTV